MTMELPTRNTSLKPPLTPMPAFCCLIALVVTTCSSGARTVLKPPRPKECEQLCTLDQQLHTYPAGTWGPSHIQDTVKLVIQRLIILAHPFSLFSEFPDNFSGNSDDSSPFGKPITISNTQLIEITMNKNSYKTGTINAC